MGSKLMKSDKVPSGNRLEIESPKDWMGHFSQEEEGLWLN